MWSLSVQFWLLMTAFERNIYWSDLLFGPKHACFGKLPCFNGLRTWAHQDATEINPSGIQKCIYWLLACVSLSTWNVQLLSQNETALWRLTKVPQKVHTVPSKCSHRTPQVRTQFPSSAHTVPSKCSHNSPKMLTQFPQNVHTVPPKCSHRSLKMLTQNPQSAQTVPSKCSHHSLKMLTPLPQNAHTEPTKWAHSFPNRAHTVRTPFFLFARFVWSTLAENSNLDDLIFLPSGRLN